MFPHVALASLAIAIGSMILVIGRQLWLLQVHARGRAWSFDAVGSRWRRVLVDGFAQRRLRHESAAGFAHQAIFFGFLLLLPRTIVLFGRAFVPDYGSISDDSSGTLSGWYAIYHWVKVASALAVLIGTGVFAYLRLSAGRPRLKPTLSALGILAAIASMMLADFVYDAAGVTLARAIAFGCPTAHAIEFCSMATRFAAPFVGGTSEEGAESLAAPDPMTQLLALALQTFDAQTLLAIGLSSYGLHLGLVLGFVIALPFTKHFHVLTVWPNLFFDSRAPTGQLEPIARNAEELLQQVEAEMQSGSEVATQPRIGKASLLDFSAKERLNLFACTACGRCTEHCPVADAGGVLDPRQLTLNLRDQLRKTPVFDAERHLASPIVPAVIANEALWSCTNCGACEERCPVAVRYVGTIVDFRRNLLLMRGEAPTALQRLFDGSERQFNPWNLPREDRANWARELPVPRLQDVEHVEYLYWVGCAASFDGRAQSIARALVKLMLDAQVTFAILGTEERCTGDPARRAGNELLFLELAQHNIELLNRYRDEGRFERIITACPHCLMTLGHDYAQFGGRYEVVSHTVAIERWIADGRIELLPPGDELLTYHDPCTLARGANITEAPRRLLARLSERAVAEPTHHGRHTACCGAGGAQLWLEQPSEQRVNHQRAKELGRTSAQRVVTACPFCLDMISDGVHRIADAPTPEVSDVAELVALRSRAARREGPTTASAALDCTRGCSDSSGPDPVESTPDVRARRIEDA